MEKPEGTFGGNLVFPQKFLEASPSISFASPGFHAHLWISHQQNETGLPWLAHMTCYLNKIRAPIAGKKKETSCEWKCIRSTHYWGFPGSSVVKNLPASAGDTGSIPGSGRSPVEGNGNPL